MVEVKAWPNSAGFASSNRIKLPPFLDEIETNPSVPTTCAGASMVIEVVKLSPFKNLSNTTGESPGAKPAPAIAVKSIKVIGHSTVSKIPLLLSSRSR